MSFSGWLQRAIVILVYFLVITTPFIFTWTNEELFEFNKMMWVYGWSAVIGGLWLTRVLFEGRSALKRTPLDWVIGAFVASQFLSTVFSIHPRTSWLGYYTRFHGGLLSTLTYVGLYYVVASTFTKKQVMGLLVTLLVSAVGVSAYSIPEHFGHSPSCWLISGGQRFNASCWVQDVQNRIFGTFGQPNWLAAYTLMVIPVGIAAAMTAGTGQKALSTSKAKLLHATPLPTSLILPSGLSWRLLMWLGTSASVLSVITLLFTKSRSGFLGLVIGLATFLGGVLFIVANDTYRRRRDLRPASTSKTSVSKRRTPSPALGLLPTFRQTLVEWLPAQSYWVLGGTITMIILLCALLGTPFTPALLSSSRPETQSGTETASTSVAVDRLESGGTDSGEIRKIVWDGAWKVGQRYPLFGSGVETFAYSYYLDRPMDHNHVSEWDFLYNKAHNELLNFWATTGVVGVGAYLALLGWFGIWSLRQLLSPQPRPVKIMLVGLVAGVVALSVSNFFGFSTVTVTLLLFILMAVAVVLTSSSDPDEQTTATSAKPTTKVGNFWSWRHVAGIAFTSGLTVYCVMRVITWWMADYHFTLGKRAFQQGDFAVANQHLQQAINFSANEALFYDELATLYANAAVAVAQNDDLEEAEQLATASLLASDTALELNPRHLNFYKTRARVFIVLGQLNETFLEEALSTLQVASTLAPTDPKLLYNQALIENALGNTESAQALLEQTLAMKPDYHSARFELAKLYEQTDQLDAALTEYQQLLIASPNDPVLLERFEVVNASLSAQTQTQ